VRLMLVSQFLAVRIVYTVAVDYFRCASIVLNISLRFS
jgi:hypothetical protein